MMSRSKVFDLVLMILSALLMAAQAFAKKYELPESEE